MSDIGVYAQPGTTMVESHDTGLTRVFNYQVTWLDPQGHLQRTPAILTYGEAHILADMLDHGEPYVRDRWVH